ncbi:PRC and DUF2382 domain-containing protein [Pseudonocardia sp. WMMC193]|nr:PRC and DUF2382 domain-containing protein [Pseudonocardia sp. WMMC193]MCF7548230.1 PRC and DUF2382 domain-containing protein [Pseudonocardia sp. WMMC193]
MTAELIGRQAYDTRGEKIGKIGQVYVDDRNGTPTWATVHTGLFGTKESFVPLQGADVKGGDVALPVAKEQVKDAPHVGEANEHLDAREEQALLRHYNVGADGETHAASHGTADRGDRRTDDRDAAVTRSEERLRVGTETEETGRVRLRKYVVTEEQKVTVPVSHEEVRLEREPIRDGERATGAAIGEQEQEVTLHAERPVVDKTTEAVERVRLGTDTVTEDETVSDTVRKERVEIDDPQNQVRKH